MQRYSSDKIRVGDVISTHNYLEGPNWFFIRMVYTILTGDIFFHTVVVVDYQGEKYVLNSYPTSEEEFRKGSRYKDRIFPVIHKNGWTSYMEPLDSFIDASQKDDLLIRVVSSGHNIAYSEEACQRIQNNNQSLLHCCYFTAKYMEEVGIIRNKTFINDALYYTPCNFVNAFGRERYYRFG
jgi:hypothetical protein